MASGVDPYREIYSRRTEQMSGSEIRALFSVLERPEIVSLAGGNTYTDAVAGRVAECVQAVLARASGVALQYGPGTGLLGLRERLCDLMALEGIDADPHHVVVTDGAQQGLELIAKVFVDPGDVILTEAPTYVGALSAFSSYQVNARSVPIDEEGLIPEELARTIIDLHGEGRRAKFLYMVPTFQNPSGVTLTPSRRAEILEVCRRSDLLIIEDNPYAQVRFSGDPVTPLRALAPDQVVYLGTLSKVFSPGIRIGWVLAPQPIRERLVLAKEAANLCTAPFNQMVAEEYLSSGSTEEDLQIVRKVYRERCQAMLDAIDRHLPREVVVRPPEGGLFVWVTVTDPLNTRDMLARALRGGVAYVPGTAFYPVKTDGKQSMRLNFSYPSIEQIEEGVERLGRVLDEELELGRSLGI
ncbi:MAG TPA: PLP-dependent aminotransferase family protein [Actinomycetota bacterium]|nr:PLP-dependent aminotransferase family protein [Actinomycetota bacterium]